MHIDYLKSPVVFSKIREAILLVLCTEKLRRNRGELTKKLRLHKMLISTFFLIWRGYTEIFQFFFIYNALN